MESISQKLKSFLPDHPAKIYPSAKRCIYCGSTENLSDEHIIPFGMGGQMVIPKASCKACSGLSSAFEGTCLRTMFGPLRMLYDLPSYRKKSRPKKLPLKVKIDSKDDWTKMDVEQTDYPFLVLSTTCLFLHLCYPVRSRWMAEMQKQTSCGLEALPLARVFLAIWIRLLLNSE